MTEVSPSQKLPPLPTVYREGREEPSIFNFIYKMFCHLPWIGECIANLWINSLSIARVYNFENLTHYKAPSPSRAFTKEQRTRFNPYIAQEFIETMERMKTAENLNPHVLAYTRFSSSFYKKDPKCRDYKEIVFTSNSTELIATLENRTGYYNRCHNALSQVIQTGLAGKTSLHIGIPYADKYTDRSSISPDYIEAVCPHLVGLEELYIHGPIASRKDRAKLLTAIQNIENLKKLHLEVDPISATFFMQFFPTLLQKPTLTELKLHNLNLGKTFFVQKKVWERIKEQERCTITLQNTPKPPNTIEHNNKLQFKSPIK